MIHPNNTLVIEELIIALEPVIRRIIREELNAAIDQQTDIFHINPDTPVYDDMMQIKKRKDNDNLEFMSAEAVWDQA